jgi:hypothetical protein
MIYLGPTHHSITPQTSKTHTTRGAASVANVYRRDGEESFTLDFTECGCAYGDNKDSTQHASAQISLPRSSNNDKPRATLVNEPVQMWGINFGASVIVKVMRTLTVLTDVICCSFRIFTVSDTAHHIYNQPTARLAAHISDLLAWRADV